MTQFSSEQLKTFFYWMTERHRIYLKKENNEPKPWTTDIILQNYRFCNVFRELDTVTVWVRKNIRERWATHPNLWFALCVARQINLPETLEELDTLLVDWCPDKALSVLKSRKEQGKQVYTSAYLITTHGKSIDKVDYTVQCLDLLWQSREHLTTCFENANALEESFNVLRQHQGFGNFISYEVVTDMRHTRYLNKANDIYTWANPGIGAIRGLNRLTGRPLKKLMSIKKGNLEMQELLELSKAWLPKWFPQVEMRDIEHSLCEFDKYERVRLGQGAPRQRYSGVN